MAAGRSFKEFVKDKCYNGLLRLRNTLLIIGNRLICIREKSIVSAQLRWLTVELNVSMLKTVRKCV